MGRYQVLHRDLKPENGEIRLDLSSHYRDIFQVCKGHSCPGTRLSRSVLVGRVCQAWRLWSQQGYGNRFFHQHLCRRESMSCSQTIPPCTGQITLTNRRHRCICHPRSSPRTSTTPSRTSGAWAASSSRCVRWREWWLRLCVWASLGLCRVVVAFAPRPQYIPLIRSSSPFSTAQTQAELITMVKSGRLPPLPSHISPALKSVIKAMLNLNVRRPRNDQSSHPVIQIPLAVAERGRNGAHFAIAGKAANDQRSARNGRDEAAPKALHGAEPVSGSLTPTVRTW